MVRTFSNSTVAEIVREKLSRSRVFDHYKIDFCCHGDRPLAEACREAGVELQQVCTELIAHEAIRENNEEVDWDGESADALIAHIVEHHHTYLRSELPRLQALLERVIDAHQAEHPELSKVRETFLALHRELSDHMMKEEQVLFPIVKQLEQAQANRQRLPAFHCGSVNNPIQAMMHEHTDAGEALRTIRTLTGGYRPPEGACETYRALFSGLEELEGDLHLHIHKENNILFPKAAAMEAALSCPSSS